MLVIDTNQVGLLPAPTRTFPTELILPPSILAEVLVRQTAGRTRDLQSLARYQVTLGKELAVVGEELAQLTSARAMTQYRPYYGRRSTLANALRQLLNQPANPSQNWLDWATEEKRQHAAFMRDMAARTVTLRDRWRRDNGGRARNWAEVTTTIEREDSYVGGIALSWIKPAGLLDQQGRQRFYDQIRQSHFALSFLQGVLYWSMCIARGWRTQHLNRDPTETRDDWSDVMLALYVGRRDSVISNDNFVREMFAMVAAATPVRRADQL